MSDMDTTPQEIPTRLFVDAYLVVWINADGTRNYSLANVEANHEVTGTANPSLSELEIDRLFDTALDGLETAEIVVAVEEQSSW